MTTLTRLRELRLERALSQYDLARLAGVARTTVVRLEQGEPAPIPSTVRKIAKALKVKPVELTAAVAGDSPALRSAGSRPSRARADVAAGRLA